MAIGKQPDVNNDDEEGGDSIFAEINITPLTDVFLVMVIIFMVSALAVQVERNQEKKKVTQDQIEADQEKRSGIKVNLPSGAAQEIDPSKASLVLVVPITGDVQVGGKAMADAELDNLFRIAFQ
jgi:biopolymer transport protein ExbD